MRVFHFDINWTEPVESAWGVGRLYVNDVLVWDLPDWKWSEFLDYLSDNWSYLLGEEDYPLGANPSSPYDLRDTLEQHWEGLPDEVVEKEDSILCGWERRHWINHGFGALYARGVCLLRKGEKVLVCTNSRIYEIPFSEVVQGLNRVGNLISDRLRESNSETSKYLIKSWDGRNLYVVDKVCSAALAKLSPEEATLELSYAADRALRTGDLDFLKALFDAVEKADFSDRVVRGLLVNTRDAGFSIESRDRLIERVCNNKKDLRERLK